MPNTSGKNPYSVPEFPGKKEPFLPTTVNEMRHPGPYLKTSCG